MNGKYSTFLANATSDRYAARTFVVFILLHLLMWTLLTGLTRHELDSDSMMHYAWGQEWQWSYYLHPPFLPWVVAGFLKTFGINNWNYVLLAQLNILVAFVALWFLARQFLSPSLALLAVCLLEFHPYYSFLSLRLNHSSMLISSWALTTLFLVYALDRQRLRYWLLAGFFAALAMLTKYYSIALLGAIGMYFLFSRNGRKLLKTRGPYLALLVFCLLFFTHLQFVFANKTGTVSHIADYFSFLSWQTRKQALIFFLAQLLYLGLPLGFFMLAMKQKDVSASGGSVLSYGRWHKLLLDPENPPGIMLCYVLLLFPFFITAVPAFVLGVDVSSRWGGPIWGAFGMLLLWQYRQEITSLQKQRLLVAVFLFVLLAPLSMLLASRFGIYGEKYSFPGKELAQTITRRWHESMHSPLKIVGGTYLAPNSIAFHSADHPSALQHLNFVMSPWLRPADIRQHGMVIVCLYNDTKCRKNAELQFPGRQWTSLQIEGEQQWFAHARAESFVYSFIAAVE